jgi:hypothetical protein
MSKRRQSYLNGTSGINKQGIGEHREAIWITPKYSVLVGYRVSHRWAIGVTSKWTITSKNP